MSAAPTIYTLAEDVLRLHALLLDAECTEETIDQAITEFLRGAGTEKLEQYCKLIRSLGREAKAIREEEKDLAAKRKARENAEERMKGRLQMVLEAGGLSKIDAGVFSIALQNNPPALTIDEGTDLPDELMIVPPPVPNKDLIRERLEAGEEIPGCRLTQGRHVRIR